MTDILLAIICLGLVCVGVVLARIHRRISGLERHLDRPAQPVLTAPISRQTIYTTLSSSGPVVEEHNIQGPPTEVVWGDPHAPAVIIAVCNPDTDGERVELPAPALSKLNHLMTGIPAALASAGSLGTYAMTFSPEVTKGLATGAFELMQASGGGFRASALAGGRIVENGVLRSSMMATSLVAVAAVWQIAAMITGQKFMAEIESRMRDIDAKLSTVLAYMEGDLRATIIAGAGYLRDAHRAIAFGDVDEQQAQHLRQRLEALDITLASTHQALLQRIADSKNKLVVSCVDVPFLTGASCETRKREIASRIDTDGRMIDDAINALAVRGMAIQLRAALGDRSQFNKERATGLVAAASQLHRIRSDHEAACRSHTENLKGSKWSRNDAKLYRGLLNEQTSQLHGALATSMGQITKQSDGLLQALIDYERLADVPMRLNVTMDDQGRITAVHKPRAN